MADLIVTFGRADGSPPLLNDEPIRTRVLTISAPSTDPVVTSIAVGDAVGHRQENAVELIAGAACWVSIGPDPVAERPDAGATGSFHMLSGQVTHRSVKAGSKVSVVSAA
jgi:hypothetical protein